MHQNVFSSLWLTVSCPSLQDYGKSIRNLSPLYTHRHGDAFCIR